MIAFFCPATVFGDTFNIAVASNFKSCLEDLILDETDFKTANLISGSSGKLYAQILRGAPFDVFLSARPKKRIGMI